MKTLNIKNMNTTHVIPIDISDRHPCWYANLENMENEEEAEWIVGVKGITGEDDKEYSFKISEVTQTDDDFWAYAISDDFAIKLIELFRSGGKRAVKKWTNEGCK